MPATDRFTLTSTPTPSLHLHLGRVRAHRECGMLVDGLAIALAAQDSLKNLLGSLMIFMDKPYKPGQRIVVEGRDGFVEQIGLRSTKIRMLTGAQTSIPNERMARLDI